MFHVFACEGILLLLTIYMGERSPSCVAVSSFHELLYLFFSFLKYILYEKNPAVNENSSRGANSLEFRQSAGLYIDGIIYKEQLEPKKETNVLFFI